MGKKWAALCFYAVCGLVLSLWTPTSDPGGATASEQTGEDGLFEADCNISGVNLYLCPAENFGKRERRSFFGLIKSFGYVCSGGELSLGTTPISPTPIPAGDYILMIPPDYQWEKEGPIKVEVSPGKKTYFLLKLFTPSSGRPEDDRGGGGGGGGGGGAGAR